ncbi:MFS transporter, putative metabolite:H+ symporter [Geodermatophilus pulveris]|uniref:MFS transporter, putative metabolite:H+ symporter n=1 Tax=Geodermatophilus pulveris TaxID=1564159 RepID=A0A239DPV3_9ACTN|nr:MFS transporter [Geodermatophilus pulveris]SNS34685.1 MFS transporter, putative metabolite:H+ symporter [Geodermatophilus pulveris]
MSTDATTTSATRAQRLDRLPFTRQHGRLVVGSGLGWALDAMDVGLISFVMAALAVQWALTPTELSWIGSIGFVGMALGATLGGLLADRVGRRQVFALTLLVFGAATGAAALAWSVASLLVFRFLIGLGLGAELPVASTLVSEYAPARVRGRVVVALEAFWAVGWLLAALIGYLVVPRSDDGWRWALALGALPALYAVVVRRGLPESVRFLELRGRTEEAEAAVRRFESAAGVAPVPSVTPPPSPAPRPRALWAAGSRRRTAALWGVWFGINFGYYGAFIWLPTLLYTAGFDLVRASGYTLLITLAQLPGYAAAAVLVERWGRRPTLVVFLLGSAAGAAAFALATGDTAVLVTGMVLSFFNLGAWGAVYAVTPEVYPTALRATGAGAAAGFGRIASIAAPLCVPPLLAAGGNGLVFATFAAAFVLAAGAALALPERRGETLEEEPAPVAAARG